MRHVITLAVLLSSAVAAQDVRACVCSPRGFTAFLAPADEARDVPRNTLVWVGSGAFFDLPNPTIELVEPEGGRIETTRRTLRDAVDRLETFEPARLLDPSTTYVIELVLEGERQQLGRFTTGDSEDHEPPAPPARGERTVYVDDGDFVSGTSSCGETHLVTVSLSPEPDRQLAVGTRDRLRSGLGDERGEGTVDALGLTGALLFGSSLCRTNWPEATTGAQSPLFVGAFDLAGNFSGWEEAERLEIPWYGGCGCDGSSATLLALLGLLLRPRSRRPRAGCVGGASVLF